MITITSEDADFDIAQIANSGQCFRMTEISQQTWEVIAFSKRLIIKRMVESENEHSIDKTDLSSLHFSDSKDNHKTIHILECSQSDYDNIWARYFDMSRDYSSIKSNIRATKDPYLIAAVNFGYGIRILQQDPWETLISFIISQRNNISRIRKIIAKLCAPYGLRFPSPMELSKYSEDELKNIGLGYRARYVRNAAIAVLSDSIDLEKLRQMPYEEVIRCLKNLDGIGDKVANCIALFGFQKLEAFPIDTWIMKILEREYGAVVEHGTVSNKKNGVSNSKLGNFDPSHFPGYAGIVQQYMFYYERFRNF